MNEMTATSEALEELYNDIVANHKNRRQVVVVLTDGNPNSCTYAASTKLHDFNVDVYAIGVTDNIEVKELNKMASDPDSKYVFRADDYDSLFSQIGDTLATQICDSIFQERCPCNNGQGAQQNGRVCQENICETCNTGYVLKPSNVYSYDQQRYLKECVLDEPDCDNVKVDVTFIIDDSVSVDTTGWDASKDFIRRIAEYLHIGRDKSHFNVIQFSRTAEVPYLNSHDKDALNGLTALNYRAGDMTNTADALVKAKQVIRQSMSMSGKSANQQFIVLLTDGQSQQPDSELLSAARGLKEQGYTVFVVGVGREVGQKHYEKLLHAMASSKFHYLNVKDYASLSTIYKNVRKQICDTTRWKQCTCRNGKAAYDYGCNWEKCDECYKGYNLNAFLQNPICIKEQAQPCQDRTFDFYVLFDGSSSLTEQDFQEGMKFIRSAVTRFDFGPGKSRITVGQYAYDYESELPKHIYDYGNYGYCPREEWAKYSGRDGCKRPYTLSQSESLSHINNELRATVKIEKGGTQTGKAMQKMLEEMRANPLQHHTKRIMIVLTDGNTHPDDRTQLARTSAALHRPEMQTTVVAIGVGRRKFEELETIASDPMYVFKVEDYSALEKQIVTTLSQKLCETGTTRSTQCSCPNGTGRTSSDDAQSMSYRGRGRVSQSCDSNPCVACNRGYELTREGTCEIEQCRRRHLEVLLVIDGSYTSISDRDLTQVKELIEEFITKIEDADNLGAHKTDVSLMVYGNESNGSKMFSNILSRSANRREIDYALQSIDPTNRNTVYQQTYCEQECKVITGLQGAEKYLQQYGDRGDYGRHSKDKSLAVIFTAAHSSDLVDVNEIKVASQHLQQYVGDVAAVGIGAAPEDAVLEAMASSPRYVFKVNTRREYDTLQQQMDMTVNTCV